MSAIEIRNLHKSFGKTQALRGISFQVLPGEILGFLGPNGAGKTTTLRCLMNFIQPDQGSIKILNQDYQKHSKELKEKIGFLSGEVHFYNNWTGKEHLQLVRKIRNIDYQKIQKLIQLYQFNPEKRIKDLSSGNKQKLGLILALMHQPPIIILDEPTNGLDPFLQQKTYELLKERATSGASIIMSSHNLSEVEKVCDRVCIIKKGKIISTEKISDLKQKKIYNVYAYFKNPSQLKWLQTPEIKIIKKFDQGICFQIKGDINLLIEKLKGIELTDLEINHANLEEIFLSYYK